jgi:hypothetical protein
LVKDRQAKNGVMCPALLALMVQQTAPDVNVLHEKTGLRASGEGFSFQSWGFTLCSGV